MDQLRTSRIEMISATHCEQRKQERQICKVDLQAAVKYGTRELSRSHNGKIRQKFEYNGVVYITELDGITSVTCYASQQLPLTPAIIDDSLRHQISEQKRRIASGLSPITSHTIIVIDQSASMNQSDVMGHRSRSRCVFYTIANEIIAAPLLKDRMSFTDVVTVIEMRTHSSILSGIHKEPISWELHNKMVQLASGAEVLRGKGHGNYLPAIELATRYLNESRFENYPVNLFFLSDGRPSDLSSLRRQPADILPHIQSLSRRFKDRLMVGTFGFGHDGGPGGESPFGLLEDMASVARGSGANSMFSVGCDSVSLRLSLSSMASSLVSTRTAMSSLAGGSLLRTPIGGMPKKVKRADMKKAAKRGQEYYDLRDYDFHMVQNDELVRMVADKWRKRDKKISFIDERLMHPEARGIAIKKDYLENGAERAAFFMTEVDALRQPVGRPLIGKKSLYEEPDQLAFHEQCARTQLEAGRIAKKFNSTLQELDINVPVVEFLEPSFYMWYAEDGSVHAVLAEKRLNDNYKKWNDNKGGVDTVLAKAPEYQRNLLNDVLENIAEGESDEEEDDDDDEDEDSDDGDEMLARRKRDVKLNPSYQQIIADDVPQAFSHWTYQYTHRNALVCDVQGVLGPSSFQLTDPAIHSLQRKFGSTDHGRKGMDAFFRTHSCIPFVKL